MKKTFNITNNISRVTFDYIKSNPGSTRKEIIEALEHKGFAAGSTSSLVAQMRRNKMIHETNNLYYADIANTANLSVAAAAIVSIALGTVVGWTLVRTVSGRSPRPE